MPPQGRVSEPNGKICSHREGGVSRMARHAPTGREGESQDHVRILAVEAAEAAQLAS